MKNRLALIGTALVLLVPTLAKPHEVEAYVPAGIAFTESEIEMYESMIVIPGEPEMVIEDHREAIEIKSEERIVIPEPEAIILEEIPWTEDMQRWAQEKCKQYNFPYAFFLAMCESESSFILYGEIDDAGGISCGTMMIRQCNWNRYDGLDAHDQYDNIEIGIRMLAELKEKYMEADMIIMAYKGGEGAAEKWKAEGFRLGICDTLEEKIIYWQEKLEEKKL